MTRVLPACLSCPVLQGLGEVYEEQYVKATAGGTSAAPDKDEKLRQEAKALFQVGGLRAADLAGFGGIGNAWHRAASGLRFSRGRGYWLLLNSGGV